jgi:hypothetical protein
MLFWPQEDDKLAGDRVALFLATILFYFILFYFRRCVCLFDLPFVEEWLSVLTAAQRSSWKFDNHQTGRNILPVL